MNTRDYLLAAIGRVLDNSVSHFDLARAVQIFLRDRSHHGFFDLVERGKLCHCPVQSGNVCRLRSRLGGLRLPLHHHRYSALVCSSSTAFLPRLLRRSPHLFEQRGGWLSAHHQVSDSVGMFFVSVVHLSHSIFEANPGLLLENVG